ncbi:MAG: ATP-binding protein [Bacteroidota bacterium]
MLVNFSVQNYRSIRDKVTLSFEATKSKDLGEYYVVEPKPGLRVLKMGIIYGANASGKTNILKALNFVRRLIITPLGSKTDRISLSPFEFDQATKHENSFFSVEFVHQEVKYLWEIELNTQAIVNETLYFSKPNKALVYRRTTNEERQLTRIEFGSKPEVKLEKLKREILQINTLWNQTVLSGYLRTNFESIHLQNCLSWFQDYLKPLILPQTSLISFVSRELEANTIDKALVLEILSKADFNISGITFREGEKVDPKVLNLLTRTLGTEESEISEHAGKLEIKRKQILFEHTVLNEGEEEKYNLPFRDQSRGTQRFYEFAGLLSSILEKNALLSIDELESTLHPDLVEYFILLMLRNTTKSQLLTTTHFRELLNERDLFRNDIIWFTEKRENGSTDLYSLADFDTSVIRKDSSIYSAYKVGKLGSVPLLASEFISTK